MASADVSKQAEEGENTWDAWIRAGEPSRQRLTPAYLRAALMYHLKQQAMRDCDAAAKAYAACATGRVFSVVWACRQEFGDLNSCLKTRYVSASPKSLAASSCLLPDSAAVLTC